jgi:hypothetical protein
MRKFLIFLVSTCSALAAGAASAVTPGATINQERAERGWFFYDDPQKKVEAPEAQPKPSAAKPKPKPDKCKDKKTWAADCGFIDPGGDFEFQAKQRDVLMERMSVSNNDAKAVEDFQRYMRWAMGRATEVANLWSYNTVQNPDLDASVNQPVSQFGIRLMSDVKTSSDQAIFKALVDEGAGLVYFTRADCVYCHSMAPLVAGLADSTGLPLWNAALDDQCMPAFQNKCRTGKDVAQPAQALSVKTVPTLFLVLPDGTWIRVSTGVTDTSSIKTRITLFFTAYRTALLKGLQGQDGRAPVDFSGSVSGGTAPGAPPNEAEIARFLGK